MQADAAPYQIKTMQMIEHQLMIENIPIQYDWLIDVVDPWNTTSMQMYTVNQHRLLVMDCMSDCMG